MAGFRLSIQDDDGEWHDIGEARELRIRRPRQPFWVMPGWFRLRTSGQWVGWLN